jgi:hypothetical protein
MRHHVGRVHELPTGRTEVEGDVRSAREVHSDVARCGAVVLGSGTTRGLGC